MFSLQFHLSELEANLIIIADILSQPTPSVL